MSRTQYATISQFGSNNSSVNDPLTYSLVGTIDKNFIHSPTGALYGPNEPLSQLYMAERCGKEWDGFCTYYTNNNVTRSYPNTVQNVNMPSEVNAGLTMGETLITNAAQRRFCDFSNCKKICQPFDPNVADSPYVCYYDIDYGETGAQNCIPICSVNPQTIDDDTVMNLCLQKPERCLTTMKNICNNAKRNGVNLSGTKIGKWCSDYEASKLR